MKRCKILLYSFFGAFWSILSCLFECEYDNVIRKGLLLHQKLRTRTKWNSKIFNHEISPHASQSKTSLKRIMCSWLVSTWVDSPPLLFQWCMIPIDRGISDLSIYMDSTNTHIRFTPDLFLQINEAWTRSENIGVCLFFQLICLSVKSDLCHIGGGKKKRNWVTWTM